LPLKLGGRCSLSIDESFQLSNCIVLGLQLGFEFAELIALLFDEPVEAACLCLVTVVRTFP
jgi:hypothetical protein